MLARSLAEFSFFRVSAVMPTCIGSRRHALSWQGPYNLHARFPTGTSSYQDFQSILDRYSDE